ncbi:MAG TPA: hypothetical protein VER14_06560 [Phototrophicaceae bacterium]|nr:hypothetical protein [Phototrophicaceae bacterium]
MSSSTDSTTTTMDTILTKNDEKGKEEKKSFIDNKKNSITAKESKFNELIQWLQKWGYKVIDRSKDNKNADILFQAEMAPLVPYSSGTNTPLFLEFQNGFDDGFIIRTTYELDKYVELHLRNQNRAREIELAYIEIEQVILPMRVSIIRAPSIINIYKVIFSEQLTKQFFYDCVTDLINAMSLIIGKWDQKYYEIRPKTTKEEPDKQSKQNQA